MFFYLEGREFSIENPTDKLLYQVQSSLDEMERTRGCQRATDAYELRRRQGYVTGGKLFGYRNVRLENGFVDREVYEPEARVVRDVYRRYAEGRG